MFQRIRFNNAAITIASKPGVGFAGFLKNVSFYFKVSYNKNSSYVHDDLDGKIGNKRATRLPWFNLSLS